MRLFWTIHKSANSATLEVCCVFWNNTLLNVSTCFTNDRVKSLEYGSTTFSAEWACFVSESRIQFFRKMNLN